MNDIKKKSLALAISTCWLSLAITSDAKAELSTKNIPSSALSDKGKKVTICHLPPGNPDNYQTITISTNALETHIEHHDDVFADKGACPALNKKSTSSSSSSSGVSSTSGTSSSTCAVPSTAGLKYTG